LMQDFPVDNFPLEDPFLPWIHDYFPSVDGQSIQFVAQNRRRCDTGPEHVDTMHFWEPQVPLFQPIHVYVEQNQPSNNETTTNTSMYRLASSSESTAATTHMDTRFQCRFHFQQHSITTLSVFPFNYEYLTWRKTRNPMVEEAGGTNSALFWLSQLLFACPVPLPFQPLLLSSLQSLNSNGTCTSDDDDWNDDQPTRLYLDVIPIRTPARAK
jgi:hypothetical protein